MTSSPTTDLPQGWAALLVYLPATKKRQQWSLARVKTLKAAGEAGVALPPWLVVSPSSPSPPSCPEDCLWWPPRALGVQFRVHLRGLLLVFPAIIWTRWAAEERQAHDVAEHSERSAADHLVTRTLRPQGRASA